MIRIIRLAFYLFLLFGSNSVSSQTTNSYDIFLLTCSPGREIETIYGHSAIRILNHITGNDSVYSWGVYDFDTPNFVWNFAKGQLIYQISRETFDNFLYGYYNEQRSVISQKINLSDDQKAQVITLINKNMLPENKFYLYDFFYDNCATRIRDLIERTLDTNLVYPTVFDSNQTFRTMINKAQRPCPWLTFGTDFIIGLPGDKKVDFRNQMFLPEYLQQNLSVTMIKKDDKILSLLKPPEVIFSFKTIETKRTYLFHPFSLFTMLLIISITSYFLNNKKINLWLDRVLYIAFSTLCCFLIFFNFITDHQATHMNLNLIWLNPIVFLAFISLIIKMKQNIWFRIIIITSFVFMVSIIIMHQSINFAIIPILFLMILRSFFRSNLIMKHSNGNKDIKRSNVFFR